MRDDTYAEKSPHSDLWALLDALFEIAPSGMRLGPDIAFCDLKDLACAERIFASGRFGSPVADMADIPASAWDVLALDASLGMNWTLKTPEALIIYDVQIRWADSRSLSSVQQREAILVSCHSAGMPSNQTLYDTIVGLASPGNMHAAARWVVDHLNLGESVDIRIEFGKFGLSLDETGQRVTNAGETIDGALRSAGAAGAPHHIGLLIIREQLEAAAQPKEKCPISVQARDQIRWLRKHCPDLDPPSAKTVERAVRRALAASK